MNEGREFEDCHGVQTKQKLRKKKTQYDITGLWRFKFKLVFILAPNLNSQDVSVAK